MTTWIMIVSALVFLIGIAGLLVVGLLVLQQHPAVRRHDERLRMGDTDGRV